MWLFTKHGFFSVTQSTQRRDLIQIRARAEKDLASLKAAYPHLDRSPIIETPQADYRWRLVVQRWKWETVAAKLTSDIDYSNFKGKIATIENQRDKCGMLHDIWSLHNEYQERHHRPDPHAGHPELFRPHGDHLMDLDSLEEPSGHHYAQWPRDEEPEQNDMEAAWSEQEQGEQDREDERKGRQKNAEPKAAAPSAGKRGRGRKGGRQ